MRGAARRSGGSSTARGGTSVAAGGAVALTSDATALSMTVERRRSSEGDHYLVGGFTFEGWEFRVAGFPARYADQVGLSLRSPRVRSMAWSECAVRVMADGLMLADPTPEGHEVSGAASTGYYERLNVIVPRDELAMMAAAERLAVRICDTELRLGPEHRAVLAEFLLRFEEELRWLTVEAAPEAPVQDLGAVTESPDAGSAP